MLRVSTFHDHSGIVLSALLMYVDNSLQPGLRIAVAKLSDAMEKAVSAWLERCGPSLAESDFETVRIDLLKG